MTSTPESGCYKHSVMCCLAVGSGGQDLVVSHLKLLDVIDLLLDGKAEEGRAELGMVAVALSRKVFNHVAAAVAARGTGGQYPAIHVLHASMLSQAELIDSQPDLSAVQAQQMLSRAAARALRHLATITGEDYPDLEKLR